ncbi:MAG: DNA methylase [Lachnospiraceae bacterium]|jgi:DNA polymerase V|nr:DNA methylase [Lachnospiraceae bacterium]MEE3461341.1 DNA methylase [Lachnospiraceae bacterium]
MPDNFADCSHIYVCIDLKSFYASVECAERHRDPLTTNLVVADESRTDKTICLAVSPPLKACGIPGRARLFEAKEGVKQINAARKIANHGRPFHGSSDDSLALASDPGLELTMIVARPRMATYIRYSSRIYNIYLKYVSQDDIFVYSVDEVFMDVKPYLLMTGMTPHQMAVTMIRDVLKETGITATAGIADNMYLAKVAMDIVAKHIPADKDGVRIAELDEMSYRELLWDHRPLTDFWRIGHGYSTKLAAYGIHTMGDVAMCSIYHEELLYKLFGINAELLIDHAFGWEPCTIADVKCYRPKVSSLSSGQVLSRPYSFDEARLVVKEIADGMSIELAAKELVTDCLELTICYDHTALDQKDPSGYVYEGKVSVDGYGRLTPYHAHGTVRLKRPTFLTTAIVSSMADLYDRIVDPHLPVRRIFAAAKSLKASADCGCRDEDDGRYVQITLFTDPDELIKKHNEENMRENRARRMQKAASEIRRRYGKNAMLKGINYMKEGTIREKNTQIGGHRA